MRAETKLLAAAALALLLGGCTSQYLDRTDTVTFGAGEAVRHNMLVHMRDPWPPASRNTHIATDGERARLAVTRYRAGETELQRGGRDATPAAAP